jgi:hypothetical protein
MVWVTDRQPKEGVQAVSTSTNKPIESRKLDDLKAHPMQAALSPEPSPAEIEQLATILKRDGMDKPVEILPDGTILCGNDHVVAAKHLGWQEIDVWVRHDLAAQGKGAAERRLIESNLARQADPLSKARCYAALKRLEYRGTLPQCARAELRKELVTKLRVSGRSVDRLLRVVTGTPLEIQDAVVTGKLALTLAVKVAGLTEPKRKQLAAEIRAGVDPATVVARHVAKPTGRHKKARHAVDAFLIALERGVNDLQGRVDSVGIRLSAKEAAMLSSAEAIIQAIRQGAALTAAEVDSPAEAP